LFSESGPPDDGQDRGLIFICFNADLERQFELVQGQWCMDGNDFGLGGEQDYLLGSNEQERLTIEGEPPFFVTRETGDPVRSNGSHPRVDPHQDRLVYTRGCEYLFMPGLAALERLSAPPSRAADLEVIPPAEPAATHTTVGLVLEEMRRNYANSRPARRGQHPKTHACVRAKFIVKNVPEELRFGLFDVENEREYDAWVRFSASHSKVRSDAKPDAQGIAIKVMGVDGEKILPRERYATTQDFVLVNHRMFFLRNARDVAEFARAITATLSVRDAELRAIGFFLRHRDLRGARILQSTIGKRPPNPLDLTYWSQTPYALRDIAVNYSVKPLTWTEGAADPSDWNGLGHAIETFLAPQNAVFEFEFRIQPQVDPIRMRIEDPTRPWNERDSHPRPVAIIRIAHQDASAQERLNFAENLSFTPWHALWDHRPLGGINRVRRAVYAASSDLRHRLNGVSAWEPDPTSGLSRPPAQAGSGAEAPW
ncbi:MAG TPA: catalase family protein, partial [Candidatus Limnocylindrales bacterium]|nr:catalase family protein [Candidatus Limnocylindrales bacterium]